MHRVSRIYLAPNPQPTSHPAPGYARSILLWCWCGPQGQRSPRGCHSHRATAGLRAVPSCAVPLGLSQVPEKPACAVPKDIGLCLHASQRVATLRVPQQPVGARWDRGMLSGHPRAPSPPHPPAPHSPHRHPPGPQHPVQLQRLCGVDAPVPGAHAQQHRRPYLWHSQRWVPGTPYPAPRTHPAPALPGSHGRWASAAAWWPPPQRGAPARRSRAAPGRRSACGTEVVVGAVAMRHGTGCGMALTSLGCQRCPAAQAGWRRGCAGRKLGSARAHRRGGGGR